MRKETIPLRNKISNRVHFIGIGGIGMSALAKYYLEKDWQVTGSDLVSSEITNALKKIGARIFIGSHKSENLTNYPGGENVKFLKVIYSLAISKDNPELRKAEKLKIKCQSYPEALGELTKTHFTIAVSGTHGKSTTTAMIGLILAKAGFDPTVIVGTKLKEFGGSNCRIGESKYLVIEADEHMASFLNYWPKIIALTTIEADHLDYYKNLKNILKTFREYIAHLPKNGFLVINRDDKNIKKVLELKTNTYSTVVLDVLPYSLKNEEGEKMKKILKVPGEHNVSNASAALTVARVLKIPDKISFHTLSKYRGAWRRFEIIEADKYGYLRRFTPRITLISDYGHHPTEIEVTLKAARERYPKKKIWCVFQPHQYQRTHYLFKDFVKVFKEAPIDKIIITDIYDVAGRENKEIKKRVNSKKLVKTINKSSIVYLPKARILNYLKKNLEGGEVVIIMGAGDIYKLSEQF